MSYKVGDFITEEDEKRITEDALGWMADNSANIDPLLADPSITPRNAFISGMIGGMTLVRSEINKKASEQ